MSVLLFGVSHRSAPVYVLEQLSTDEAEQDDQFRAILADVMPRVSRHNPVLSPLIAQADSVRAALLLVSRGEAPLGIVYATDAAAVPNVRIVGTFPEGSHPPIVYPVAILKDSKSADAAGLLDFLRGPAAATAFRKAGFTVLNRPHSGS